MYKVLLPFTLQVNVTLLNEPSLSLIKGSCSSTWSTMLENKNMSVLSTQVISEQ